MDLWRDLVLPTFTPPIVKVKDEARAPSVALKRCDRAKTDLDAEKERWVQKSQWPT